MKLLVRRPSPAMVVAMIALIVSLSGTAIAARKLVAGDKLIKKHSLSGNRLRNHTVTGKQIKLNSLGKVPTATNADNAKSLGGLPASFFSAAGSVHRSGLVTLTPQKTGVTVLRNGPLSITADCTSTGFTTVTVYANSTVDNWVFYAGVKPAGAPQEIDSANDSGSPGAPKIGTNEVFIAAPSGQSLEGKLHVMLNWPAAGQCSVIASGIG